MAPEIRAHRRPDLIAVRHRYRGQGTEMALAYRRVRVRVGQEGRALHGMQPVQFGDWRADIDVSSAGWRDNGRHWGLLKGRRHTVLAMQASQRGAQSRDRYGHSRSLTSTCTPGI